MYLAQKAEVGIFPKALLATSNKLFGKAREQFQQNPEQAEFGLLNFPSSLRNTNGHRWKQNNPWEDAILSPFHKNAVVNDQGKSTDLCTKHNSVCRGQCRIPACNLRSVYINELEQKLKGGRSFLALTDV